MRSIQSNTTKRKNDIHSRTVERAHVALLEIQETKYDPMGLEGVRVSRCQGVRTAEI
jgi:hypothetical protein